MDVDNLSLAGNLVSASYISQGRAALSARHKLIKSLLSNKRLPQSGWDEATIEMLIQDAALMDSNTFPGQVGLGEREGRVVCPLVARRHHRLAHGIGRSGDIAAEQPKAAGSSLLAKLTAHLAGDALRLAGLVDLSLPLVLPCATGMTLTLVLLAAAAAPAAVRKSDAAATASDQDSSQQQQQQGQQLSHARIQQQQQQQQDAAFQQQQQQQRVLPRYVIWSRIDQKTCLKAITAANLIPVVVELQRQGDMLVTDVTEIERVINRLGGDQVAAVVTTTSCFAPRASDDVISVARLCHHHGIPHIINNAYGVQCKALTAAVTAACRKGRVDAIVQSTDKNFMVPVGGAIVAAPAGKFGSSSSSGGSSSSSSRDWLVQAVAKNYPGRASMSAHLDLLLTLLHLGADGWVGLLRDREDLFDYLKIKLTDAAGVLGERVLETPGNPISLGMTLDGLATAAAAAAAAAANNAAAATAAGVNLGEQQAAQAASSSSSKKAAKADVSFFGSMLWARNVSGTRVLTGGKQQTIAGITFQDYGCHISHYPHPYMTAAAAVGGSRQEVDVFVSRLVKCYKELEQKWNKAAAAAAAAAAVEPPAAADGRVPAAAADPAG